MEKSMYLYFLDHAFCDGVILRFYLLKAIFWMDEFSLCNDVL